MPRDIDADKLPCSLLVSKKLQRNASECAEVKNVMNQKGSDMTLESTKKTRCMLLLLTQGNKAPLKAHAEQSEVMHTSKQEATP